MDDGDGISERSLAVTRVREALGKLDKAMGSLRPVPPQAAVLISESSTWA